MVGGVWNNHSNKVLQKLREKERKKRVWSPSQREMNKVGEDRKDEKKRRIYEDIWERSGQRQTEREREREERVCVCWAEALSDVFACSRVCSSVCTCVSLLRASHATECTFLTLSILHTHTHTHSHSFPLRASQLASCRFLRSSQSSAASSPPSLSSPLLSQTPPPPTLFLSLTPFCFALISLSVKISWYSWWQMSFLW